MNNRLLNYAKEFSIQRIQQCCGSGSGTGSVRIRNFWPDPDPIQNRNKHFGSRFESGFETGSETGSEIQKKKEPYIQAKIRCFHTIIHISVGHWINRYCIAKIYRICHRQPSVESAARDSSSICRRVLGFFSSRPN